MIYRINLMLGAAAGLVLMSLAYSGCLKSGVTNSPDSVEIIGENRKKMSDNKPDTNREAIDSPASDVSLTCKVGQTDDQIKIDYDVKNNGSGDIYLLDVYPEFDKGSDSFKADFDSFFLSFKGPDSAFVLRGIPPLPTGRSVTMRVIPLGSKLPAAENVSKSITIKVPVDEENKWYYAPLKKSEAENEGDKKPEGKPVEDSEEQDFELVTVGQIIVRIQFLRSTADGFIAEPVKYTSEGVAVRSQNTTGQTEFVQCVERIKPVELRKRKDLFTRP